MNNKDVRGEFTKEALELLENCEQRLGESFQTLQMVSLQELLKKREARKKKEKKKKEKKESSLSNQDKSSGNDDGNGGEDDGPDAVIVCPACESRFRMKDNEVLLNATLDDTDEESE